MQLARFLPRARLATVAWLPCLVAAVSLLPFGGLLLSNDRAIPANKWISCDYGSYQLPVRRFAREEMLAGRFPTWIPWLACGLPLHAMMQASLCHPVVTPLVLLLGADYGLKAALFLHLAIGWAGMYRLARAFEISPASSAFAALVATWSGFSIGHLMSGHLSISIQYALIPWFFLALSQLLRRPAALPAASLAVLGACFVVSGHPQILFYALLAGSLWAFGSLCIGSARTSPRAVAWGSAAVVTGLLLGAVQIVPTAELVATLLRASSRSSFEYAAQYCLDGVDLLRLISPNILGNPFTGPEPFGALDHFHERVVYLGVLPPLLAAFGLTRQSCSRWQWGAVSVVLLLFAIALGRSTPVFDLLGTVVPGLRLFRCQGRAFCVASVLIALLAGMGLDSLARGDARAAGVALFKPAAAAWVAANLIGVALASPIDTHQADRILEYLQENGLTDLTISNVVLALSLSLLAIARCGRGKCARVVCTAAILVTAADLGYFNARGFRLGDLSVVPIPADLRARRPPIRFVDATDFPHPRRTPLQYSRLVPTAVFARRSLVGTNEGGLLPEATETLFKRIEQNQAAALALAACGHACAPRSGEWLTLPGALPRIRFLPAMARELAQIPIDGFDVVKLDVLRTSLTGQIQVISETPRELSIQLVAPSPGRLIVADTWYPGWRCHVDGVERRVTRANEVFRSVEVTAGRHKVLFSFEPRSFHLGAACTVVGAALLAALLFGLPRRAWRVRPTSARYLWVSVLLIASLRSGAARAGTRDPFDIAQGAQVVTASETLEGAGIAGMFGEVAPGGVNAGVTLFRNGGASSVEFKTASTVALAGVELLVRSDNRIACGPRSVDRFSFYADADGDGEFETTLVDRAWPHNDGSPNVYSFAPIRASTFKAEFKSGWRENDDRQGPRIVEINGVLATGPGQAIAKILGAGLLVVLAGAVAIFLGLRVKSVRFSVAWLRTLLLARSSEVIRGAVRQPEAKPAGGFHNALRGAPWTALLGLALLQPFLCSVELRRGGFRVSFAWAQVVSGDEPHYLVMVNSLIADGDLDLANNYASAHAGSRQAGQRFAGRALDHHVKWYNGERLVTWCDVFEMPRERWRKDALGHPVPTLKSGFPPAAAPKREYSWHPPGMPLLLFPLLYPLRNTELVEPAALFCSALATFAAALFFRMLVRRYTPSADWAWFVTAVAFLGTPAWHYARTFFCEPYVLACAVAAYAVVCRWPACGGCLCGGLILAAGVLMKLPLVLLVVPLALIALCGSEDVPAGARFRQVMSSTKAERRRCLARIAMLGLPIAVAIVVLLILRMDGESGRLPMRWRSGNPLHGAWGLLFSPNSGLISLSPVALAAAIAWPSLIQRRPCEALPLLLGIALYFGVMATWIAYHGGACYGPRLIVPVVPLFFASLVTLPETGLWRSRSFRVVFGVLAAISIFFNAVGAFCATQVWNTHPLRVLATCFTP